jgi:prepilin-type N-terminal cleavage/methylation domain-containing protein/prepilin-type processing-associated H-X9-DG protein
MFLFVNYGMIYYRFIEYETNSLDRTFMKTKLKEAFTLIELLVVISIIAVLMAIMMPALGKAREQARRMVCSANIRQIVQGLNTYAMDNEGYLVPDRGIRPNGNISGAQLSRPWDSSLALQMSTDQKDVFKKWLECPSDKKPRARRALPNDTYQPDYEHEPLKRSYNPNRTFYNGTNYIRGETGWPELRGDMTGIPVRSYRVRNPSQVIHIGETHIGIGYVDPRGSTPSQYGSAQGNTEHSQFSKPSVKTAYRYGSPMQHHTLHENGGNYGFTDGSVRWHGLVVGEDYNTGQPYKDLTYPNNWQWQ